MEASVATRHVLTDHDAQNLNATSDLISATIISSHLIAARVATVDWRTSLIAYEQDIRRNVMRFVHSH